MFFGVEYIRGTMHVAELWRYPVKSMAGEMLTTAEVGFDGIAGDRSVIAVRGNRIATARTHPQLLRHHARWSGRLQPAEVLVDGEPWDSEIVAEWVRNDAGNDARLVRYDGPERFDVLPLLVATDGAIAALGVDRRRFRPNILIGGVEGLAEREWEGKRIRIGAAVIHARDLRQRCVMTTYDPDTQHQDIGVLRRIVNELDGTLALNCSVIETGIIRVGDGVDILDG